MQTNPDPQYNPAPEQPNSIQNFVQINTTTPGPQVPVVSTLDANLLAETYQRINGARFAR